MRTESDGIKTVSAGNCQEDWFDMISVGDTARTTGKERALMGWWVFL